MFNIKIYTSDNKPDTVKKQDVANFLTEHLEEYGDPKPDILKAMDYALQEKPSDGGFILTAVEDSAILGAVVINRTGMAGYIPENILVYIATHRAHRGRGIGKKLMQEAIQRTDGNIALHVEPDNPARFLYEKVGFSNKYLEMRLIK